MEETTQTFMSQQIDQISAALSEFQGTITQPKLSKEVKVKTKTGGSYNFKYADLSACVDAAKPKLKEHGLAVSQIISNGYLVTMLCHKSGQWIKSSVGIGVERISDYQQLGSAITYLKRYSYCAILGLVADSDDDANIACGNYAVEVNRQPQQGRDALLAQALKELNACKDYQQYGELWVKWSNTAPELCKPDSPFYKACQQKAKEFDKQ